MKLYHGDKQGLMKGDGMDYIVARCHWWLRTAGSWKTLPVGVKNDGQRNLKPRATKFKTTGNEIYRHGQRNLSARATKFIGTGNEIYRNGQRNLSERATKFSHKSLCFFAKGEHIEFFFLQRIIYICACKKKNQYLIAGRPPKGFFFYNKIGKKNLCILCAVCWMARRGASAWKKKRLSLQKETAFEWLRRQDSNLRPLGYEPNELPLLHSAISLRSFSIASAKVEIVFE